MRPIGNIGKPVFNPATNRRIAAVNPEGRFPLEPAPLTSRLLSRESVARAFLGSISTSRTSAQRAPRPTAHPFSIDIQFRHLTLLHPPKVIGWLPKTFCLVNCSRPAVVLWLWVWDRPTAPILLRTLATGTARKIPNTPFVFLYYSLSSAVLRNFYKEEPKKGSYFSSRQQRICYPHRTHSLGKTNQLGVADA